MIDEYIGLLSPSVHRVGKHKLTSQSHRVTSANARQSFWLKTTDRFRAGVLKRVPESHLIQSTRNILVSAQSLSATAESPEEVSFFLVIPPEESIPGKHLLKRSVRFGPSTCFLCSAPLRSRNRSDEHVFPKWLQNRFKLWNQRLDLINQTSIPYKQITIPCCKTCNNEHLSRLENTMREAVAQGPAAVEALPRATVYMWLSKIFYGILYRESLLRADRKQGKRPIIPKKLLQELRLHHDFMQGIRRSLEFPAGIPGSIFIYGTSVPDRTELQFDFLDNHENRSIALRMGSVGLICCFQDGGMTKEFHDHLKRTYYRDTPLHPVQFREATAEVFYKSMLLESTAFYVIAETPEKMQIVTQLPAAVSFHDWDWLVYCRILGHYWNQPVEELYGGDIGRASSLSGEDGEFLQLDPNAHYSFLVPDKWKEMQGAENTATDFPS